MDELDALALIALGFVSLVVLFLFWSIATMFVCCAVKSFIWWTIVTPWSMDRFQRIDLLRVTVFWGFLMTMLSVSFGVAFIKDPK